MSVPLRGRRGLLEGLLLLGLLSAWPLARRAGSWSDSVDSTRSSPEAAPFALASAGVELREGSRVTGDVLASGRVRLSGGALVEGEIKEGQEAWPLLDLSAYDPGREATAWAAGRPRIRGRVRHEGALTIGDLKLDSGLLYVNGPLTVTGKVTGNGAIVVRGPVTVTGQMNLESDLVALVADGDVVVQGKGQEDGTRVQGLVYTKGSFKAQDSTIVGAVVSARVDGTTELDRVNMVQVPGVTDFEVVVDERLEVITLSGKSEFEGFYVGVDASAGFMSFTSANVSSLRDLAEALARLPVEQQGAVQVRRKNIDGSVGDVVLDTDLKASVKADRDRRWKAWKEYLELTADGTVARTEIFKLDLNSFLSVQGELEVVLWKSERQRLDR